MKILIAISVIVIILITYVKISNQIKRDKYFVESVMMPSAILGEVTNYSGYIIIVERQNLIHETNLLREIVDTLQKKEKCILIEISYPLQINSPDTNLIDILDVKTIPSIIHIDNNSNINQIFSFDNIPIDSQGHSDTLYTIKSIVGQV